MRLSRQRLGDNPKDHDGVFNGLPEGSQDVVGLKPDATNYSLEPKEKKSFEPWTIYPKPPPPHWHWKDQHTVTTDPSSHVEEDFQFSKCDIPREDAFSFELDDKGVYQVYAEKSKDYPPVIFFAF